MCEAGWQEQGAREAPQRRSRLCFSTQGSLPHSAAEHLSSLSLCEDPEMNHGWEESRHCATVKKALSAV